MNARTARNQAAARSRDRFRHASRRGLTFLEVILSVVMLSLVAGMIMSAINGVMGAQIRQHQKLNAAEVANRLMWQYIDDQDSMPARGLPVVYGRDRYRWDLSEKPVTLTPARADSTSRGNPAVTLSRLKTVQLHVWLSDESGGSYTPDSSVPSFTLSRIVDPIFGQLRNPDTADHIMHDPVLRQRFMDAVTNMAAGAGTRPVGGTTRPGATPGSTPGSPPGRAPGGGTPPRDQPRPPAGGNQRPTFHFNNPGGSGAKGGKP